MENTFVEPKKGEKEKKKCFAAIAVSLSVENGGFQEIEQKFLLSWHLYLPCDRDIAKMEKEESNRKLCSNRIGKQNKNYLPPKTLYRSLVSRYDVKDFKKTSKNILNTIKLHISLVCVF